MAIHDCIFGEIQTSNLEYKTEISNKFGIHYLKGQAVENVKSKIVAILNLTFRTY